MSKIRLYGSTSGYLELKAPDVSPDAEVEIPASFGPYGKVLQVSQTVLDTPFSASISDNTWATITGLSASITPLDASSTLLVIVNIGSAQHPDGVGWNRLALRVYDGSNPFGVAASPGSRNAANAHSWNYTATNAMVNSISFIASGSASNTSARTYTVQAHNAMGSSKTLYVNRSEGDTDNNDFYRTSSSIIVMEIGA